LLRFLLEGNAGLGLGWRVVLLLAALRGKADQVGLARPPSRRARAPAGPGVPRDREEYKP
jgi:hypothetical protein